MVTAVLSIRNCDSAEIIEFSLNMHNELLRVADNIIKKKRTKVVNCHSIFIQPQ